ncbi:MAG: hypothetical protein O3A01_06725, partial [bacterium]|nr:hypothetical protein [bacterium]
SAGGAGGYSDRPSGFYSGGPGAGWTGVPNNSGHSTTKTAIRGNLFVGGTGNLPGSDGGFGGAGAAGTVNDSSPDGAPFSGGGGGYSGGAAGFNSGDGDYQMGGGAGSYIVDSASDATDGGLSDDTHGYVIITYTANGE